MHRTLSHETPDVWIDGKDYTLETLQQFRNLTKRTHLKDVKFTDQGIKKHSYWEKHKKEKPWENTDWREHKNYKGKGTWV